MHLHAEPAGVPLRSKETPRILCIINCSHLVSVVLVMPLACGCTMHADRRYARGQDPNEVVEHGLALVSEPGTAHGRKKIVTITTNESVLFPLRPCNFSGIKAWCPAQSGTCTCARV